MRYALDQIEQELTEFEARLAGLAEQRQQLVEEMTDLQARLDSGDALTEDEQRRLDGLREQVGAFGEEAGRLADDIHRWSDQPELYEFQQSLRDQMQKIAEGLDAQRAAASDVAGRIPESVAAEPPTGPQRQAVAASLVRFMENEDPFDAETERELERMDEDLERLKLANALVAQAERIRQVVKGQTDLAQRMARFRDAAALSRAAQKIADHMAA